MSKSVQKIHARELRKEGLSIKEIAKKVNVSVSSISVWCRDIELTSDQIKMLENRAKNPYYGKRAEYIFNIKQKTNNKIESLRKEGVAKIGQISKRELFLLGVALYWAEGFKKDKQVGFANQDPTMILLFIRWLEDCFEYKKSDLSLRVVINISHQNRIDKIIEFWSTITGIPVENFQKTTLQNIYWKKTYENPNEYYGVLRIKVKKSLDLLREIYGYIDGIRLNVPN